MLPAWTTKDLTFSPIIHHEVTKRMNKITENFIRKHMITIILAALMLVEGLIVGAGTAYRVRKETEERMAAEYAAQLEAYKAELAYQEQAKSFLSGTDSLNVAINQAVDAIAPVVARLQTDAQKQTEVGIMIARSLNPGFPNSLQEVAEQEDQWPLYDGTNRTYTAHDWELVEQIVRPFMENGILPLDLTSSIVFATWSQTDLVGRDSYYTTSTMNTWRYHG